jgi:homoserine kinase type II
MATFTALQTSDAQRIADAHELGTCTKVIPVPAGTVNSNYFLETARGRFFVRVYEQQEAEGVAYEWALVDHLAARGVAVAQRIEGPAAGELRVENKPVAVFARVHGEELCQRLVTADYAHEVGRALALAARAAESFPIVRSGRFTLGNVRALHARARAEARPELDETLARLSQLADELEMNLPTSLPRGVVHGDLFRDNVLWQGHRVVALLDWESASDGVLVYDLAVTLLAWCCGDHFDWVLARALTGGYVAERLLSDDEWQGLWWHMRMGCLRFATTRISDVYLRGRAVNGYKDYRRFLMRLDALETETPETLVARLGGRGSVQKPKR